MTPIYRLVHKDNLPLLLEWGGDYSPNQCRRRNLSKRSIHHSDIIGKRGSKPVPCHPGATLADYVPFYFRPRPPMLFAIKGGKVPGCSDQREILYLQSSAEAIAEAQVSFAFTDGHALVAYARFFAALQDLDKVPWDAVKAAYWNDLPDGRFKCQAEFLVRDFCALTQVVQIGVFDGRVAQWVQAQLDSHQASIRVAERRGWYF